LENGLTNLKRNKMEKETLEEVATKVLNTKYPYHRPTDAGYWKDMFISGVNYQAERSYSEEEVKSFLDRYRSQFRMDKNVDIKQSDFIQWFNKFKKK